MTSDAPLEKSLFGLEHFGALSKSTFNLICRVSKEWALEKRSIVLNNGLQH